MKKLVEVVLLAVAVVATGICGDVYVPAYVDSSGNYHAGYHRTSPDSSLGNNYSTQGNYNPYTGKEGTVNPNTPSGGYGSGHRKGYNFGY